MKSIAWNRAGLCLAGCALLAGCGGGGGGGATVETPEPAGLSAGIASSAGALAFVKRIGAASDHRAEPVEIGDAVLATSENDEPDPGI